MKKALLKAGIFILSYVVIEKLLLTQPDTLEEFIEELKKGKTPINREYKYKYDDGSASITIRLEKEGWGYWYVSYEDTYDPFYPKAVLKDKKYFSSLKELTKFLDTLSHFAKHNMWTQNYIYRVHGY